MGDNDNKITWVERASEIKVEDEEIGDKDEYAIKNEYHQDKYDTECEDMDLIDHQYEQEYHG